MCSFGGTLPIGSSLGGFFLNFNFNFLLCESLFPLPRLTRTVPQWPLGHAVHALPALLSTIRHGRLGVSAATSSTFLRKSQCSGSDGLAFGGRLAVAGRQGTAGHGRSPYRTGRSCGARGRAGAPGSWNERREGGGRGWTLVLSIGRREVSATLRDRFQSTPAKSGTKIQGRWETTARS